MGIGTDTSDGDLPFSLCSTNIFLDVRLSRSEHRFNMMFCFSSEKMFAVTEGFVVECRRATFWTDVNCDVRTKFNLFSSCSSTFL